jgi:uncharacterized protein YecE (DUF72 family)
MRQVLEERGAALAIGDDKRRPLPEARAVGELAYLRLHWRSRREVFVYLNNDWKDYAPANARHLARGLSSGDGG